MLGLPQLPRNLEASLRDLSSSRPDVRRASIVDLVRHAGVDPQVRSVAIARLAERLSDEAAVVRAAAAVGLGDLEATEAVPKLLVATSDDVADVRQFALNALGEIGDRRALPRLRHALSDARPDVRYQAVIAFSRVAGRSESNDRSEVDDALFTATADPDDAVAHIALRVAEERIDQGQAPDGRLVARARTLVDGERSHVAAAAAILLAKAGDERGSAVLRRIVRGERIGSDLPDKEDERAAVELAGELGMVDLVPDLERRVWGVARLVRDTCTFHARIALARMGNARAKSEILSELGSSRRDVQSAAVVSAGRARLREARARIGVIMAANVDPDLVREALSLLDA
jgi:HEAT repeat protein